MLIKPLFWKLGINSQRDIPFIYFFCHKKVNWSNKAVTVLSTNYFFVLSICSFEFSKHSTYLLDKQAKQITAQSSSKFIYMSYQILVFPPKYWWSFHFLYRKPTINQNTSTIFRALQTCRLVRPGLRVLFSTDLRPAQHTPILNLKQCMKNSRADLRISV